MKHPLLCVFIVTLISCDKEEFTVDCLPEHLRDGVISFYPFENGELIDASGRGNDLTNPTSAFPASDRDNNSNCAYEFENNLNVQQFLTTSETRFLNRLSRFSIALWYQPINASRRAGDFETLLARGDEGHCPDRSGEWSVGLFDCRRAVFGHNNSVWAHSITGTSDCGAQIIAVTDLWHHVVAVYNNDTNKIYFNGVLQELKSGPAICSNPHLAQDIGDVFIGSDFTGRIDDVLIYDREVTAQEVLELFESEPCCG